MLRPRENRGAGIGGCPAIRAGRRLGPPAPDRWSCRLALHHGDEVGASDVFSTFCEQIWATHRRAVSGNIYGVTRYEDLVTGTEQRGRWVTQEFHNKVADLIEYLEKTIPRP